MLVQILAKHWRLAAVVAFAVILVVAWETSLIPHYVNDCTYQYETYTKKWASNHMVLVSWRHISEFIEHYDKIISALSGVAVAAFTGTLWWSTRKLWKAGLAQGAVAGVVGIRRGAISGNMKVQFQAARSIG